MNERIKQFAEQVGAVRNVLAMGRHDGVLFTEFELEKFAELIVRECAQVCKTVSGDQVSNASEDYQKGREMGAEVCYNMIRKHFGVE
jgi:hypothetical protein